MSDPATLPTVPAGLIWDGVTEYQDTPPEIATWLCRMYGDGTRRFTESEGASNRIHHRMVIKRDRDGWESIGVCIERPDYPNDYRNGQGFLHYDGTLTDLTTPPDQQYQLQNYRAHAARFAHQLGAAWGHKSLQEAPEADRIIVHDTLAAMIGSAARRYDEWDLVDPEEIILGGTYDGTLLWKRNEQDYIDVDAALCGQCAGATFARRFLKHADLPAFRRAWRQGIIYSADRTVTPWAPELFDVATPPAEDFYDALDDAYDAMIDHYDELVGAQDHA